MFSINKICLAKIKINIYNIKENNFLYFQVERIDKRIDTRIEHIDREKSIEKCLRNVIV